MSCGFGAVVLIFLIINHNSQDQPPQDDDLLTQLRLLDFEVLRGQEELYALVEDAENTQAQLANTATERAAKEAELAKLIEQLQEIEGLSLAEIAAAAKLRSDIESRKTEVKRLQALERANAGSDHNGAPLLGQHIWRYHLTEPMIRTQIRIHGFIKGFVWNF